MTRDEAKSILLLYRGQPDEKNDPQIFEALSLSERDAELAAWLGNHLSRQKSIAESFRKVAPPPAFKEQIISEQKARLKASSTRRTMVYSVLALSLVVLAYLFSSQLDKEPGGNGLAVYQNRMVGIALRGYSMDLETNELSVIRGFLARSEAPSEFSLPAPLQKIQLAGCAVESWQNTKVSMICFRTGKLLAPGTRSDMWLFVVDQNSVGNLPHGSPELAKVNQLVTASWVEKGKLFLLGTSGNPDELRKYL